MNQAVLDDLYDSVRRAINHHEDAYDTILLQYRCQIWKVLIQNDGFTKNQFDVRVAFPANYVDEAEFNRLKAEGQACVENGDYRSLRTVINQLDRIERPEISDTIEHMYDDVNVLKA